MTNEKLTSQDILLRIENARLGDSDNNRLNCAGFVISIVTGSSEAYSNPNSPEIEGLLRNSQRIGESLEYDLELAKDSCFIGIGFIFDDRIHYLHFAVIDPNNPQKIYQRFGYTHPVTSGEGSELLAPFLAEKIEFDGEVTPASIIYFK